MTSTAMLSLLPLPAMLLWAAVEDFRTRRIRNWLTFSMILTGLLRCGMASGTLSLNQSLLGILVGGGLPMILFAIGGLGGGDVKLLAGVGAWLGPFAAFQVFCAEAIIGMVIVLMQAASQGRLRTLWRNSTMLALNITHVNELGVEHVAATGQSCRSVDRPLPYAVPVLLAVLVVLSTWL